MVHWQSARILRLLRLRLLKEKNNGQLRQVLGKDEFHQGLLETLEEGANASTQAIGMKHVEEWLLSQSHQFHLPYQAERFWYTLRELLKEPPSPRSNPTKKKRPSPPSQRPIRRRPLPPRRDKQESPAPSTSSPQKHPLPPRRPNDLSTLPSSSKRHRPPHRRKTQPREAHQSQRQPISLTSQPEDLPLLKVDPTTMTVDAAHSPISAPEDSSSWESYEEVWAVEEVPLSESYERMIHLMMALMKRSSIRDFIKPEHFVPYLRRRLPQYATKELIDLRPVWQTIQQIPGVDTEKLDLYIIYVAKVGLPWTPILPQHLREKAPRNLQAEYAPLRQLTGATKTNTQSEPSSKKDTSAPSPAIASPPSEPPASPTPQTDAPLVQPPTIANSVHLAHKPDDLPDISLDFDIEHEELIINDARQISQSKMETVYAAPTTGAQNHLHDELLQEVLQEHQEFANQLKRLQESTSRSDLDTTASSQQLLDALLLSEDFLSSESLDGQIEEYLEDTIDTMIQLIPESSLFGKIDPRRLNHYLQGKLPHWIQQHDAIPLEPLREYFLSWEEVTGEDVDQFFLLIYDQEFFWPLKIM